MDEDVRTMVEQNSFAAEDTRTELLVADYFVSLRVLLSEDIWTRASGSIQALPAAAAPEFQNKRHFSVAGGGQQLTDGQGQKETGRSGQSWAFERRHRQSTQRSRRSHCDVGWLLVFVCPPRLRPHRRRCPHVLMAGVEKLMRTYAGNASFSNQKNLEETEQLLDEVRDSGEDGGREGL